MKSLSVDIAYLKKQTNPTLRTRFKEKPIIIDQWSWKQKKTPNQLKTQPKQQQTPGIPTITTKANNPPPKKLDNNNTKDNPTENETTNSPKKMKHKLKKET